MTYEYTKLSEPDKEVNHSTPVSDLVPEIAKQNKT